MRQQINLYRDSLIDKPEPFQSKLSGLILAVTVAGLFLAGSYNYWQARSLTGQTAELRQQQQVATARVAELEEQYPAPEQSALLQEKIQRLEQELQSQQIAMDYFSRQDQESNKVILESLEKLALSPLSGLWLQRISILQRGQSVQLAGSAFKSERVPEYLQLLADKNIFGGRQFARLTLDRSADKGGQINFQLDSVQETAQ